MRLRRSPQEISDRLLQEFRNLALAAYPPRLRLDTEPPTPLPGLPAAQEFAASFDAAELRGLAAQIRAHRFPLLGLTLETGPDIAWRRDYVNAKETPPSYFRLVPYLDAQRAGDHKLIWELNRHQHLVVLALDGDPRNLDEIVAQLNSWFQANPFQRGMNWASALEVGFRALSWLWIYHLVGNRLPAPFRAEFLQQLYWHGCHLENNLSFYFSPNTHLLGEAVALHALGCLLPQFPRSKRWRDLGGRVVREQIERQVHDDGSHFEQSTYYHVYALDMLHFHATLETPPAEFLEKLQRMRQFLFAVMGPAGRLPFFGDDDGGRFFYPYGRRDEFGRASVLGLSAATHESHYFPDIGMAVLSAGDAHVVIDAGPFGPWSSGHSHSDTLSFTARTGSEDVLIDPGTYTYVGDLAQRDWFRSSAAHNTIRIDGRDQAIPAGPFRWTHQPQVTLSEWNSTPEEDFLDAQCVYAGCTHRRRFRFIKSHQLLLVLDRIDGPPGDHKVEQFWHLGSPAAEARIVLSDSAQAIESWASSAFAEKHPSPALCVTKSGPLPQNLAAAILLGPPAGLKIHLGSASAVFDYLPSGQDPQRFELLY